MVIVLCKSMLYLFFCNVVYICGCFSACSAGMCFVIGSVIIHVVFMSQC